MHSFVWKCDSFLEVIKRMRNLSPSEVTIEHGARECNHSLKNNKKGSESWNIHTSSHKFGGALWNEFSFMLCVRATHNERRNIPSSSHNFGGVLWNELLLCYV